MRDVFRRQAQKKIIPKRSPRSGKIIGTFGWGHPGPFAAYRLVIQSVAHVKARKLPPPK
jgi:hypothetical protein